MRGEYTAFAIAQFGKLLQGRNCSFRAIFVFLIEIQTVVVGLQGNRMNATVVNL